MRVYAYIYMVDPRNSTVRSISMLRNSIKQEMRPWIESLTRRKNFGSHQKFKVEGLGGAGEAREALEFLERF